MKFISTTITLLLALTLSGQINNYSKIQEFSNNGNHKEVIELSTSELTKIKRTDTLYKKIIWTRVDSYMATENFVSAIMDWEELLKLNPTDHRYYEGLAFSYWAISDLKKCLENIDKAYKLSPSDLSVLSNMSYYYGEAGKYTESVNFASTGLMQKNIDDNNKGTLLNNRGFAYLQMKQLDKALMDINNSIDIFPNNSFAYFYRALTNIELNKMETVCNDLEKSKSLGGERMTKEFLKQYCEK